MLVHSRLNVWIQIADKNFIELFRPWPKKIFVISFSQVQISRRMGLVVRVDESEKNLQNNLIRKGSKKKSYLEGVPSWANHGFAPVIIPLFLFPFDIWLFTIRVLVIGISARMVNFIFF